MRRKLKSHRQLHRAITTARAEPLEMRSLLSASMVKDINVTPPSDYTGDLTVSGSQLYFVTKQNTLWVTEGTTKTLLRPGTDGAERTSNLLNVNGTLYFGIDNTEIWKSDGTAAGTVKIASVTGTGTAITVLGSVDNICFFVAGTSLYRTDGTEAGTYQLGITCSNDIDNVEVLNGRFYFEGSKAGGTGYELWSTDGTVAGTTLVKDLNGTTASSYPTLLTRVGDKIYFTAQDEGYGHNNFWLTDGTEAGTLRLTPGKAVGPVITEVIDINAGNGFPLFTATTAASGRELWVSDGTPAGTVLLKEIGFGSSSSYPSNISVLNGKTYFFAKIANDVEVLWTTNGTTAGTREVVSSNIEGPVGLSNVTVAVANGKLVWFSERTENYITEHRFWSSDGTPAGTTSIVLSGHARNNSSVIVPFAGEFYYDTLSYGVWHTDGTLAGTRQLVPDGPETVGSGPLRYTSTQNGVVFVANDGPHGSELWRTDGTEAGTYLLADLVAGTGSAAITEIVSYGGYAYFGANSDTYGDELWRTNGTTVTRLTDIKAGTAGSNPNYITPSGGYIYFSATNAATVTELYRYNPANGAVTKISGVTYPMRLSDVDGVLYFEAGSTLYRLNGTTPQAITPTYFFEQAVAYKGKAYFAGATTSGNFGLFQTDGTAAGLTAIKGFGSSTVRYLRVVNGLLTFWAVNGSRHELWKSDGTAAGTTLVKSFAIFPDGWGVLYPTAAGNTLYFNAASTADTGRQLWASDGTPAGTRIVKQWGTESFGSYPTAFVPTGNGAYFSAEPISPDASQTVYFTDGTEAGTHALTEFFPQMNPIGVSEYEMLVHTDGSLYISAYDGVHSSEPWRITPVWSRAGSSYSVTEGKSVQLDGSASGSVIPGTALTYLWDLDGDGIYGETGAGALRGNETGAKPTFNATALNGPLFVQVSLKVTNGSNFEISTATVNITNQVPSATLAVQGRQVTVVAPSGGFDAPADLAGLTFSYDWNNDGTYEILDSTGTTQTIPLSYFTNLAALIRVRVRDADGAETILTTNVTLAAPTSRITRTPGNVAEGTTVSLQGNTSTVTDGSGIVSYEWDLDYDGTTFDPDVTGSTAVLDAINGPTTRTVALRTTSGTGVSSIATNVIQVVNVAPTASFAVVGGSTGTSVGFSNVSDVVDDLPSVRYSFDFNGDGVFEITDSLEAVVEVPASFRQPGTTITIKGQITDGVSSTLYSTILSTPAVSPPPDDGGTTGNPTSPPPTSPPPPPPTDPVSPPPPPTSPPPPPPTDPVSPPPPPTSPPPPPPTSPPPPPPTDPVSPPPPPAHTGPYLAFTEWSSTISAGGKVRIVAQLKQLNGSVVATAKDIVTFSIASGPGSLIGATAIKAKNGVATFSKASIRTAGTYIIRATAPGYEQALTGEITVTPGAVSKLISRNVVGGDAFSGELVAQDKYGNAVTGTAVTLSLLKGPAGTGPWSATVVDGAARFADIDLDAGTYTFVAVAGKKKLTLKNMTMS